MLHSRRVVQLLIVPLFLLIILTASCEKETLDNCQSHLIQLFDMKPYHGENIECEFFLDLYSFNGDDYGVLNSKCADIVPTVINCEGENICQNHQSNDCRQFWDLAKFQRIIGIEK